MVAECGMSEAVGPVYIKDSGSSGPQGATMLSESTKQQVDAEVRSMLVEARAKVVRLLNERLGELHTLSRALLEHETLTAGDIKRVLAGERLAPPGAPMGRITKPAAGKGDGGEQPAAAGAVEAAAAAAGGRGVALDEQ
jgi:hypothetical protein